jgi:hypothetical protein
MFKVSVNLWKSLSEDDLWQIAMDRNCDRAVRAEAMNRWLFPEKYGYSWSKERVENVRSLLPAQRVGLSENIS